MATPTRARASETRRGARTASMCGAGVTPAGAAGRAGTAGTRAGTAWAVAGAGAGTGAGAASRITSRTTSVGRSTTTGWGSGFGSGAATTGAGRRGEVDVATGLMLPAASIATALTVRGAVTLMAPVKRMLARVGSDPSVV